MPSETIVGETLHKITFLLNPIKEHLLASHRKEPERRDQVEKEKSKQVNVNIIMEKVRGSRAMVTSLSTQISWASEIKGYFSNEEVLVDNEIFVSLGTRIGRAK